MIAGKSYLTNKWKSDWKENKIELRKHLDDYIVPYFSTGDA